MMKSRKAAAAGVLTALSLVLGYVESLIPIVGFPGMKLGLGNMVIMVSIYLLGPGMAIAINLVRILLSSVLFGSMLSLWYSLAGGALSITVMLLLKNMGHFHVLPVSIAGATAHNVGQLLVAMILIGTTRIWWYLILLWFSGIGFGAVIGFLANIAINRMVGIVRNDKKI